VGPGSAEAVLVGDPVYGVGDTIITNVGVRTMSGFSLILGSSVFQLRFFTDLDSVAGFVAEIYRNSGEPLYLKCTLSDDRPLVTSRKGKTLPSS